jgi:calreticulin
MIDNPEFKGEWKPKQIDNPAYKGVWVHPMIDNPDYKADPEIYKFDDVCGIGFDLWQVKSGTIFDNVLVTDDVEYAKKVAETVWKETAEGEKKMKDAQEEEEKKKDEETSKTKEADDDDDDEDLDEAEDKTKHEEF